MSVRTRRVVTSPAPACVRRRPAFDPPNPVYEAVEAMFKGLGLDRARAGTPEWNPLGDLVAPGDRVIIKPNLVSSKNLHQRVTGRARRLEHARLAASNT